VARLWARTAEQSYLEPYRKARWSFTRARLELERYLEKTHTDAKRPISIPSDIPPLNPPEYQMEVCVPKWKEVEQAVRKARASSSPGPNGVSYRVYKIASGVLRILWKLIRVAWEKQVVPHGTEQVVSLYLKKKMLQASVSIVLFHY